MKFRNIGIAMIAAAAISPSISSASPEKTSMTACASAFATSIAAPGAQAPRFKLTYLNDGVYAGVSQFYAREYTFDMQARDPKSGVAFAHATCTTNRSGVVIALSSLPLDGATPTLAARR
jgi:hypothetical protein